MRGFETNNPAARERKQSKNDILLQKWNLFSR